MPKMPDVYTADMGNPPVEQDAGILARGKRGMPPPAAMPRRRPAPMPARPNPADAGIFTADKGIQPPSPDEGPTLDRGMTSTLPVRPRGERQMKAAKDIRSAMGMKKGGSVSSASKRADGCATKGKTKGRFV